MSDKTWGLTETGSVFHSFKANDTGICRSNIKAGVMFQREGGRTEDAVDRAVAGSPHLFRKCGSCAKREAAFRERAEASMQPVGEYDQACEGITGYGDAAPSDECETFVDAEAMRQADDALAFAMDAGTPAAEVDDTECVDADGNVYPEHTEDDECRRCGAEMTGEPDVDGAGRTYVEDAYDERLVTADNLWKIDAWLDAVGVYAKPHFDYVNGQLVNTGIKFGNAPTRMTAFIGDTIVRHKDGSHTVLSAKDTAELDKLRADRRERAAAALVALSGTSGRTVTQKPAIEVDPFAGGPTAEEARANVVRRLPRGTRVEGTDMAGEPRTGTVNGYDVGAVNNPGHVNHQRIYVGVTWDGELSRGRAFADELDVVGEQPVSRKSAPLAGTRVRFTPTRGPVRTGTVSGREVGTINRPGHVLHGAVHVGVDWDGGGHDAVFADSLTEI